jgi:INO80 complex subunit C
MEEHEADPRQGKFPSHATGCANVYGNTIITVTAVAFQQAKGWTAVVFDFSQSVSLTCVCCYFLLRSWPDVSIRSAPSSLPARKYCDVSGLPALYTDPRTRLHFHSTAEYKKIQAQSTEVIKIMLELRGQTPTHQLMLR